MDRLLYDADCAFCTRTARIGMHLGLRAQIVPLQSADLSGLGIDPDRALREIPFASEHGDVSYGAEAIAQALDSGNLLWRLMSRALRSWPVRHIAGSVYGVVARNRHRLPGGRPACQIT